MWDPYQYARFSAHRSRPFFDLLTKVEKCSPDTVVDLGCGSGELTRFLARRWPKARVVGVDSSSDMLTIANNYAVPGRFWFEPADLTRWEPPRPVDLVFSNAVLHWIPDHAIAIPRIAAMVSSRGALAFQIPNNYDNPSHKLVDEVARSPRWKEQLGDLVGRRHVQSVVWYVRTLIACGFTVDAWETEYTHLLRGERPVLEWLKGTTLRPILNRLNDEGHTDEFLEGLGAKLDECYPKESFGTLFPFRRILVVASRNLDRLQTK